MLWLSGIRRAGKTVLCQSLDKIEYFDNEVQGRFQRRDMRPWRNKRGHEVDVVLARRGTTSIRVGPRSPGFLPERQSVP